MGNLPESVKVGTDMITSTSNAQIKKIIQLNTKGKARRNSRAFVVEGVKMFLEAPLDWIEEVYLAESFLEKYQGSKKEEYKQELLEKLETTGYETVSDQVFRHAADTKAAGMTDDLTKSIHYGEVSHFITDFMQKNTYQLIESAAEQLAQAML